MSPDHPLLKQLESVCATADREFARGAALHGARILCKRGCSDCCGQVFRITEPEAARISQFVAALPAPERDQLRATALDYLHKRARLFGATKTWESPLPHGARLPCPALGPDGACRIYSARPIICRKFGVPVFNPDKGSVMACELNFKPGDPIEDGQLVSQQTALYRAQQDLQSAWNASGAPRVDDPLCVASALAKDLSGLAR